MKHAHSLLAIVVLLASCASADQAKVSTAATTPLNDLNLVNAAIPEVLAMAQKQPYALPTELSCEAMNRDVRALDEVLGADLDAPASPNHPSLVERGGDAAAGALQRTAEGIVPFRGWVRKLTGAERYSRQVAAAIAAGTARRAFIKGLAVAKGCRIG
ncbi:MAG: hypothetical protein IPP87_25765 [Ideonella sp.]|nr:hypothetical protein [Ideonella sp.]